MTRAAARSLPSALHPDLFGAPLLPGLSLAEDIVTTAEEADYIGHIEASALTPFQFQQWEGKRLTPSFGWTYDFQTGQFARGETIPDWLLPLRDRAADFARLAPSELEQAFEEGIR